MNGRPRRPDRSLVPGLRSRTWIPAALATLVLLAPAAMTPAAMTPAAMAASPARPAPPDERPQDGADPDREAVNLATFDRAWSLIADTHWDPTLGGLDWQAVRDELRPRAAAAKDERELRRVIEQMVARLGQSHFGLLPSADTDDVAAPEGDQARERELLPGCSSGASAEIQKVIGREQATGGSTGIDLRLVDSDQVVVTRVAPSTPAAAASVETGWRLLAVDGSEVASPLACIERIKDPSFRRQIVLFWLRGLTDGAIGEEVRLRFETGKRREQEIELRLAAAPGEIVRFGNLPPSALEFERSSTRSRKNARVAVVRFNLWLPPVAAAFESAMPELRAADAVVVDLRGNPGGISAIAQGVAGHFVAQPISLGSMKGRRDQLELVAQPRRVARDGTAVEPYAGPLAVLIDEGSASTSELFAAGLRDHDRVRLFGAPSAGAALPAVMDRLPNGDVFMHASMDYIRPNGERVEGKPIVPDIATPLRRADLRAGRDAALEAALAWIDDQLAGKRRVREEQPRPRSAAVAGEPGAR